MAFGSAMTSRPLDACVLDLHEAASGRLPGIERFDIAVPGGNRVCSVRIALPASYTAAKARKRRYPLLVVFDAQMCFGSAVEMSRLMRSEEHTSELQSLMRI